MQLQVIEVALGVAAAFFVLSTVASAFVELGSILFKKRSKDLQIVIDEMLSTGDANAIDLRATSVWRAMQIASRRKRGVGKVRDAKVRTPSYMSARSFADGVVEALVQLKQTNAAVEDEIADLADGPLKDRLRTLKAEFGEDVVAIKAGLETWFDDTMDRLEGAYKRWVKWILFVVGTVLAIALNVSAIRIVDALWNDSTLRAAVADQAALIVETGTCEDPGVTDCPPEEKIERAIDGLEGLKLPVGWTEDWSEQAGWLPTILGMLLTGGAVMLGGPFWFDLLTRLVAARGARGVPPRAGEDRGSATMALAEGSRAAPKRWSEVFT